MIIIIIVVFYIGKKLGFEENFRFLMVSGNVVCGFFVIGVIVLVVNVIDKEKGIVVIIVNVIGIFFMFLFLIIF